LWLLSYVAEMFAFVKRDRNEQYGEDRVLLGEQNEIIADSHRATVNIRVEFMFLKD